MRIVKTKGETEVEIQSQQKQEGEYDITKSSLNKDNYKKLYYEFTHTIEEEIDE